MRNATEEPKLESQSSDVSTLFILDCGRPRWWRVPPQKSKLWQSEEVQKKGMNRTIFYNQGTTTIVSGTRFKSYGLGVTHKYLVEIAIWRYGAWSNSCLAMYQSDSKNVDYEEFCRPKLHNLCNPAPGTKTIFFWRKLIFPKPLPRPVTAESSKPIWWSRSASAVLGVHFVTSADGIFSPWAASRASLTSLTRSVLPAVAFAFSPLSPAACMSLRCGVFASTSEGWILTAELSGQQEATSLSRFFCVAFVLGLISFPSTIAPEWTHTFAIRCRPRSCALIFTLVAVLRVHILVCVRTCVCVRVGACVVFVCAYLCIRVCMVCVCVRVYVFLNLCDFVGG